MRALISVSDKRGIAELARGLLALGYELVSTGGTSAHLAEAGIACTDVAKVTDFPEMLGGRVKTLHPRIFAGILARENREDREALAEHGIQPIDVVVVNLYPFVEALRQDGESVRKADPIEQIDIGGPSLLRAAAKNCARVYAVVDAADYAELLSVLRRERDESEAAAFRRFLAAKVFQHTAGYDAAIAEWFASSMDDAALPASLVFGASFQQALRYGENPHQRAAFYRDPLPNPELGVHDCEQLQGKELSYNNLLDLSAAINLLREFAFEDEYFCCILKHNNPCGAALADTQILACSCAWEGDAQAAYGSVIGFARELDAEAARFLADRFVELVVAPSFSAEALSVLSAKKNLRVMCAAKPFVCRHSRAPRSFAREARRVRGGWLYQEEDEPGSGREHWSVASKRQPSGAELDSLDFLWRIVKHVRSNAICIGAGRMLLGCGAGQMSRIDAVRIAAEKVRARAAEMVAGLGPLALASDAYFPFRDNIDLAAEAGVRAVIQPGGSIRDDEVRAACDEHDLAEVLSGRRHFLH